MVAQQAIIPRVALFVTCIVELLRPSVITASIKLLTDAHYRVVIPPRQTCCGQPGYNSGNRAAARSLAARTIRLLQPYERVILPSGSCAAMIINHYPKLFSDETADEAMKEQAERLAAKTHELTSFLVHSSSPKTGKATATSSLGYHHSCSCLRELNIKDEPLQLLQRRCRIDAKPLKETCCGFGGVFCIKYPRISTRMADDKLNEALNLGVTTLTSADMGCLVQLAGRARKCRHPLSFYHISEVLSGQWREPSLGSI